MFRFTAGARQVQRNSRRAGLLAAAAVLLVVTPAAAQDSDLTDINVLGWSLNSVRLSARLSPDYMGSDDYRLGPSGSINLSRKGTQPSFGAPDDGVSLGLFGGEGWSAGLSGRWLSEREDKDDLRGFEKIDWTIEAGAFVNYWPNENLRLRGEVRRGFNGHEAWVANLGADAVWRNDPLVLSIGPRLGWGNEKFVRTYFGVDPIEAARSPLGVTPYAPDDAAFTAGAVASAEYRLNSRWSVAAAADYRRLLGDAADSPIVADLGSPDQFSLTLGVRYMLGN
jgi:MipA family protein